VIGLFEAYFHWTDRPADALAEGLASARTALALDSQDPFAQAALGALLAFTGKHDEALAASHRALELDPSNSLGYVGIWLAHMFGGEPEPGIRAVEAWIRLSPKDAQLPVVFSALSALHYLARDYARAAEVAQLAVQGAPNHPIAWRNLANAHAQIGRVDEARAALAQFLTLAPKLSSEQAIRASTGFRDEAVFQHYLEGLRKAGWTG
jgi:adenylate cyclase